MENEKITIELSREEKERLHHLLESFSMSEKELLFLGYKVLAGSTRFVNEWKDDSFKFAASPITSKKAQERVERAIKNNTVFGRCLNYWVSIQNLVDSNGDGYVFYKDLQEYWKKHEPGKTDAQFDSLIRLMKHEKIYDTKKEGLNVSKDLYKDKDAYKRVKNEVLLNTRIYIHKVVGELFVKNCVEGDYVNLG